MTASAPSPPRPTPPDLGAAAIRPATVVHIDGEEPGTRTYWLEIVDPAARAAYRFEPGQINMLYRFGLGEVPISVSSDPAQTATLAHTVRAAGRVTDSFAGLAPGDEVGLRGPFGRPWPLGDARGGDLVVLGGGLGIAPLISLLHVMARERGTFRRCVAVVGARTPAHVIFRSRLEAWRAQGAIEVVLTVDTPAPDWPHRTGVVPDPGLFDDLGLDPDRTTVCMCGPEVMMVLAARQLVDRGLDPARVHVSLERNMQCAVRRCGHCQLGPRFVCADGPVFPWSEVAGLLEVPEL